MTKLVIILSFLLLAEAISPAPTPNLDTAKPMNARQNIKVLELRNYLLRPNSLGKFAGLFNERFVQPMTELGGYTYGQFTLRGVADRFVWMRGYHDVPSRVNFLNDFYVKSEVWRTNRTAANALIVNSDNVYLLRPFNPEEDLGKPAQGISGTELDFGTGVVVVDLFVCNACRDQAVTLLRKEYLPFLGTIGVRQVTLWISEMTENEFPRLPAFQNKDLLVTITKFDTKTEYETAAHRLENMPAALKTAMLETITTRDRWVLDAIHHPE